MRTATLAFTLMLLASSAAATSSSTEFYSPAEIGGQVKAESATWLFIIFDGAPANGAMTWQSAHLTNTTRPADAELEVPSVVAFANYGDPGIVEEWDTGAGDLSLEYGRKGRGHLVIEAESIEFVANMTGTVFVPDHEWMAAAVQPEGYYNFHDRQGSTGSVDLRSSAASNVSVTARGIRYLQWAGANTMCDLGPSRCPTGGGVRERAAPMPGVRLSEGFVEEATPVDAELTLSANSARFAMGGDRVNLSINGWARLPLASAPATCGNCTHEGTLAIQGQVVFSNLQRASDARMAADLTGDAWQVRLDETSVSGFLQAAPGLAGVGVAAVAAVVLVAWKVIGWLLVKSAMDSPRRRQIMTYIESHPGSNFRTIARELDLHQGNLARHLLILQRADLIIQRRLGNSNRYFENHGRYDASWRQVAVLHDSAATTLVNALRTRGPSSQRAIVTALRGQNWSRTAVQRRLRALQNAGLVSVQRRGTSKIYSCRDDETGNPGHSPP